MEKYKEIYNRLQDDVSKEIFANRLLFSVTSKNEYIMQLVSMLAEGREFIKSIERTSNRYLFGAGAWGREFASIWKNYPPLSDINTWEGFIDNNREKEGTLYHGLKIIMPEDVPRSSAVFITTRLYYSEIKEQLLNIGFNSENIFDVGSSLDLLSEKQYFDLKQLPHCSDEVFVDVGAFDGLTTQRFTQWSNHKYEKAILFEADPENIDRCRKNLDSAKIEIIPMAAWSSSTKLYFNQKGNGSSSVVENTEEGNACISAISIDEALGDRRVTFIKMDIEGAELEALIGAEKVITTQKPKLAIALYHKSSDLLDIPLLLLKMNPNYRFYLRHYSLTNSETVLYAF